MYYCFCFQYGKLRELRLMLEDSEPDVMVTTKKLVMVTLMEVFKDIIPDYRIRVATDAEKEQAAKKETKKLRDFEESLVNNYRHYLEFLESVIKGIISFFVTFLTCSGLYKCQNTCHAFVIINAGLL